MERKIQLKTLNKHITCKICRGYFIDATTVTECLHTCKYDNHLKIERVGRPHLFMLLDGMMALFMNVCNTFPVCKSCLVKHLEENSTCPACDSVIHQSHPLNYISFDRTMQDIVYKLVPNLQESKSNFEFIVDMNSGMSLLKIPFTHRRNKTGKRFLQKP